MPSAARPRRILMTADTVGGVWVYALELARALAPHGVEVALATMGAPLRPAQWAAARRLPNLTVHESDFRLEWMEAPWADVARAGTWLMELEERIRPDLVHLNGYAHGALPWHAPTLVVGHSCVLSWWRAVRGEDAPPAWQRYREAVARGLRAADRVAAPTRAMLAALEWHYGPLPAARVLPNGRAAAEFAPQPKASYIFAAGRLWDEAKNIGALARVAPQLPWPVWVAGDTRHPDGGECETGAVRALGRLDQAALAGWLGRAAIYALPARYEPFGLSVLEAGLAGCALVLGDIPSLRELWDGAACFVDPQNPDALGAALTALCRDEGRRARLAAAARARALGFGRERMAAAYLDAYGELLSERAALLGAMERLPAAGLSGCAPGPMH